MPYIGRVEREVVDLEKCDDYVPGRNQGGNAEETGHPHLGALSFVLFCFAFIKQFIVLI